MKKQLTVALGLAVLATPAFASKARLQALGEDTYGSFYINDNRNIFLNAAHVNNHKDLVTFETGDTTNYEDGAATPRAEGGVFFDAGNLVWGVHLGSESDTSNALRTWAGAANEQNNLDVFVGGDAGMKWGVNLTYGNTAEGESINNDKIMRTRLGVITGDLEAFANISLMNKTEGAGAEFEGKLGYQLGATYQMNDYKLFGEYRSIKGEDKTADSDAELGIWRVGAGRSSKLNDKATLFSKLELNRTNLNLENGSCTPLPAGVCTDAVTVPYTTGGEDYITTNLPLTIGLEYDATSWLALRASISQSLYSSVSLKDTANTNLEDTTVVNAGASLKFGDFAVDGVIGNDANGSSPAAEGTESGTLRTDSLMSRVSMTYRF
jgi:hypothetical protein